VSIISVLFIVTLRGTMLHFHFKSSKRTVVITSRLIINHYINYIDKKLHLFQYKNEGRRREGLGNTKRSPHVKMTGKCGRSCVRFLPR
jgi:hypothetical protein